MRRPTPCIERGDNFRCLGNGMSDQSDSSVCTHTDRGRSLKNILKNFMKNNSKILKTRSSLNAMRIKRLAFHWLAIILYKLMRHLNFCS